jgi:hypothetical protein
LLLGIHICPQRTFILGKFQHQMDYLMKYQKTSVSTLAIIAIVATTSCLWIDAAQAQDQVQAQVPIYGSQLMTAAERTEYQTKMRALETDKERDAFRLDHHDKMTVRAAEKGVTLPNPPPAAGTGPKANTGPGVSKGSGMGTGQGSPAGVPGGGKGPSR